MLGSFPPFPGRNLSYGEILIIGLVPSPPSFMRELIDVIWESLPSWIWGLRKRIRLLVEPSPFPPLLKKFLKVTFFFSPWDVNSQESSDNAFMFTCFFFFSLFLFFFLFQYERLRNYFPPFFREGRGLAAALPECGVSCRGPSFFLPQSRLRRNKELPLPSFSLISFSYDPNR